MTSRTTHICSMDAISFMNGNEFGVHIRIGEILCFRFFFFTVFVRLACAKCFDIGRTLHFSADVLLVLLFACITLAIV